MDEKKQTAAEQEIEELFFHNMYEKSGQHFFFRPGQEEIVTNLLHNVMQRESGNAFGDVFALLKTGGGKSICFQYPAIKAKGITIVVSPLIALMNDQVRGFNERMEEAGVGYRAITLRSDTTEEEAVSYRFKKKMILENDESDYIQYKILYVSPEKMTLPDFMVFAKKLDISMVIIDEAHCLSLWGWDYRQGYLKIERFINSLNNERRPVIASFTATATKIIAKDIINCLDLRVDISSLQKEAGKGYVRDNLFLQIKKLQSENKVEEILTKLLELYKKQEEWVWNEQKEAFYLCPKNNGKIIIYCSKKADIEMLITALNSGIEHKGHRYAAHATSYHSTLNGTDKENNFLSFRNENADGTDEKIGVPIMIATKAFGMGIDMGNIDVVIHYDIPDCIEDYCQQVGRAGRDTFRHTTENPAYCILYYNGADIRWRNSMQKNSILISKDDKLVEIYRAFFSKYRLQEMLQLLEQTATKKKRQANAIERYIEKYFSGANASIKRESKNVVDALVTEFLKLETKKQPLHVEQKRAEFEKRLKNIQSSVSENTRNNMAIEDIYDLFSASEKRQISIRKSKVDFFNMNTTKLANVLRKGDYVSGEEKTIVVTQHYGADILIVCCNDYKSPQIQKMICENAANVMDLGLNEHEDENAAVAAALEKAMANKGAGMGRPYLILRCANPYETNHWYGVFKRRETHLFVKVKKYGTVKFKVTNGEGFSNLNFFDLMVADAIYTMKEFESGKKLISSESVIRCLTGDYDARVYKRKSDKISGKDRKDEKITESIRKLMAAKLEILWDTSGMTKEFGEKMLFGTEEPILCLKENDKGKYQYIKTSILYRFAESGNGQFFIIPFKMLHIKPMQGEGKCGLPQVKVYPYTLQNIMLTHLIVYRVLFENPFYGKQVPYWTTFYNKKGSKIIRLMASKEHSERMGVYDYLTESGIAGELLRREDEKPLLSKYQEHSIAAKVELILRNLVQYYDTKTYDTANRAVLEYDGVAEADKLIGFSLLFREEEIDL